MVTDLDYVLIARQYLKEILSTSQDLSDLSPAFFDRICPTLDASQRRTVLLAVHIALCDSVDDLAELAERVPEESQAHKLWAEADHRHDVLGKLDAFLLRSYPREAYCHGQV
jgi:hypothetical protein